MLKMKFVGAIEGISGSCTWLHHTDSNTQLLVDCGLHQGDERELWHNTQPFPFKPAKLKYVLLTHAHIDHCGLLPRLVREGFRGLVYATRATRELTEVMLLDAARVSGGFTEQQVLAIRWSVLDDDLGFKWGRGIRLAQGLRMAYLRSSHILGACLISLSWRVSGPDGERDKGICFSGDIGCQSEDNPYLPLMKEGQHPYADLDYIVVESTYGARARAPEHQCAATRLQRLGEVITHTLLHKGGKVLLPAFSLHRTQELLMDVLQWMQTGAPGSHLPNRPVTARVHAPLGWAVTRVYAQNLCSRSPNGKFKYLNQRLCTALGMEGEAIEALLKKLVEGQDHDVGTRGKMTLLKPAMPANYKSDVVIASAGMCDHGPVTGYLERWGNDPRNTVILTGYQSPGSRGAELMARATPQCVDDATRTAGLAEVVDMSAFYSAHADQGMLLDFLFRTDGYGTGRPATVLLNHGNVQGKQALREAIEQRAHAQRPGERRIANVQIGDARWINLDSGLVMEESAIERDLREEVERLRALLSQT